jgi:CRISPR-associated protein Cmr1
MVELKYRLSFNTPAFLGNAEQQAQWRTPPIKALIRQWWRVVKARSVHYDTTRLLEAENLLFGAAGEDKQKWGQSKIRLRLAHWVRGEMREWPDLGIKAHHREVQGGRDIGADLYLGFGPLEFSREHRRTALAKLKQGDGFRTAIPDGSQAKGEQTLSLRLPREHQDEVCTALSLAVWFGALGSRSRNGWGSFDLSATHQEAELPTLSASALRDVSRPMPECLRLDWAHAIGQREDGAPAVWLTSNRPHWREAMRDLAELKIAFRTHLSLEGKSDGMFATRHLLGYPVTNHSVREWSGNLRLGGQIRFKVHRGPAGYRGSIVHLPCRLPANLLDRLRPQDQKQVIDQQFDVWRSVHRVIDSKAERLA